MSSKTAQALLVVLAASVLYLPTIDDYFTQDDFGVVQLLASKPWTTFPRWFVMPWMEHIWGYTPDEIRPFVAFTYQVTAIPGAGRPELHHILNILIHAANALLVGAIARRAIGLSAGAATFAGVIFGLLPVQAESVAWITGRVDSMPAFFYFATFLAYVNWRQGRGGYGLALALFFVALFSKQNTITMVATLAAYDLLVLTTERRGPVLGAVRAWIPFAAMTLGYLALRRALFGASVRGGIESWHQVEAVWQMVVRHTRRAVFGDAGDVASWEHAALIAIASVIAVFVFRIPRFGRHVLCFGLVWWAVGVAPVLVAGYESPRHVYLAAAAWAFMLGLFHEAAARLVQDRGQWVRRAPIILAVVIATGYAVRLRETVNTWGSWAAVSELAVRTVSAEAAAAPDGTLLLVNVPRRSWEWGTPFVLQPPYAPGDLSTHVRLVTPFRLHCCGAEQWERFTREALDAWMRDVPRKPIVALHVAEDGSVSRASDADSPDLRSYIEVLAGTDSWQTLDDAVIRITGRIPVRRE